MVTSFDDILSQITVFICHINLPIFNLTRIDDILLHYAFG